mgnify:CR=1 FL=1
MAVGADVGTGSNVGKGIFVGLGVGELVGCGVSVGRMVAVAVGVGVEVAVGVGFAMAWVDVHLAQVVQQAGEHGHAKLGCGAAVRDHQGAGQGHGLDRMVE